jgi:hypothetical protein
LFSQFYLNGSDNKHNACVDGKIADYLTAGTLPPRKPGRQADATCPLS